MVQNGLHNDCSLKAGWVAPLEIAEHSARQNVEGKRARCGSPDDIWLEGEKCPPPSHESTEAQTCGESTQKKEKENPKRATDARKCHTPWKSNEVIICSLLSLSLSLTQIHTHTVCCILVLSCVHTHTQKYSLYSVFCICMKRLILCLLQHRLSKQLL